MTQLDPRAISAIIHAKTTNDASGNPRRCFILLGCEGNALAVVDEGYLGEDAWHRLIQPRADGKHVRDGVEASAYSIRIMPAEYRRLLRDGVKTTFTVQADVSVGEFARLAREGVTS